MPNKIRRVYLLGTAWPYRGGLSAMNERLAQEFTDQGYEVVIHTFILQYPNFLFPGKSQYDDRPKPRYQIHRTVNSINPFNWIMLGLRLRREAPDLIIVKYWMPFMAPCFGTILRVAKRNRSTRVVSILDNLIPHERRFFDAWLSRYFVGAVDGFIALSRSVLEDINAFDQRKPRAFSPHPVYDSFGPMAPKSDARNKLKLEEKGKYALFFGFIRDYKGLDLLLDAMADPRIEELGIRLIVAGEFYGNEDKYRDQIQSLGIAAQLELHTNFIPDDEIGTYFNACDVVVQPYKTATQSGVTQIAYHFEKPMIVTNVGGLPEIVPHGEVGFVVDVNASAVADALVAFFAESPDRFKEAIAEQKKAYSWTTMLDNILSVVS